MRHYFKDLTGKQFGRLTSIRPTERRTNSGNIIWECVCTCGKTEKENNELLHIDHVKPLYEGNGLKPGNAIILCKSCNSSKRAKSLDQLSVEDAIKIILAAEQFRCYWESIQETPIAYEDLL